MNFKIDNIQEFLMMIIIILVIIESIALGIFIGVLIR